MSEIAAYGRVSDPSLVVQALPGSQEAMMLLERVPNTWIDDAERQDGIRLAPFDQGAEFRRYGRGHVFSDAFELRWEGSDAAFQAVYVGVDAGLPELTPAAVDLTEARDITYDLWGERVSDPTVVGQGPEAQVFAELRIPRLLTYPVSAEARRVRLRVREYFDSQTGAMVLSRFCGLEEQR